MIFRMIEITLCTECAKTINTENDTFVIVDKEYYCYDCNLESCTRCESMVGSETLIKLHDDFNLCENCWDDL
jgi:hypothetical protein